MQLEKPGSGHGSDELRRRATRIRQTLEAMRKLASDHDPTPRPLHHGITELGRELARVERQLRSSVGDRPPASRRAMRR